MEHAGEAARSSVPDARALLRAMYDAAVDRASASRTLPPALPTPPRGRTFVLGAGKAAAAQAVVLDAVWPRDAPLSGLVVTRYGHVPPTFRPGRIAVAEAGHPLPDDARGDCARIMLSHLRGLRADDLVIALFSGGGSALLGLPADGVTFDEKRELSRALLLSGASISEMNAVRKHLSAVKGGRLALACGAARLVTLLVSDVPGDAPDVIASGPTVPDRSTCADALAVLDRHRIAISPSVRGLLQHGALETPKPGDARFAGHEVKMLATPRQSLDAAAEVARAAGIAAYVLADDFEGEAREVGKVHAALARAVARHGQPFARPCVLLSGGETTVTVRNERGRGGRATELLLACALALDGEPRIYGLCADTDGIDGTEDNAGAVIDPDTLTRARQLGLDARALLDENRAYDLFAALGDLVITGPTFTNVNDFRALLVV